MNLQPPDPEEFPGTAYDLWEHRFAEVLRTLHAHQQATLQRLIDEMMMVHMPQAHSDFETWFHKRHGLTLAEAWKQKRMRAVIADACDCWATAQVAQRKEHDRPGDMLLAELMNSGASFYRSAIETDSSVRLDLEAWGNRVMKHLDRKK